MRYSKIYIPTVRDVIPESEALNYRLLYKGGYIRKHSPGTYNLLPLGSMLLDKLMGLFRKSFSELGCFQVKLPSGFSLDQLYSSIGSGKLAYKDLPLGVWHTKQVSMDGIRPRLGLFQTKHWEGIEAFRLLECTEQLVQEQEMAANCLSKLFDNLNIPVFQAERLSHCSESGTDQLLLLPDANGDETIISCKACDIALAADSMQCKAEAHISTEPKALSLEYTPNVKSIGAVAEHFKVEPRAIVKTLIYKGDYKLYGILIRGDRELSEIKLKKVLNCHTLRAATETEVLEATGAEIGFAGPVGLNAEILCDYEAAACNSMIVGANKTNYHYVGAAIGRDFKVCKMADLRVFTAGDKCPKCGTHTEIEKGFLLAELNRQSAVHSKLVALEYISKEGSKEGVSVLRTKVNSYRLIAAMAEYNHDDAGLVLPNSLTPFHMIVMAVHGDNELQKNAAEEIYYQLKKQDFNVLLDDRTDKISTRLADAELMGIPLRITVGRKIPEGIIELKHRQGTLQEIHRRDLMDIILKWEVEHAEKTS